MGRRDRDTQYVQRVSRLKTLLSRRDTALQKCLRLSLKKEDASSGHTAACLALLKGNIQYTPTPCTLSYVLKSSFKKKWPLLYPNSIQPCVLTKGRVATVPSLGYMLNGFRGVIMMRVCQWCGRHNIGAQP